MKTYLDGGARIRGTYTATIKISALAAAKTLIYITAPSNRLVEVLDTHIGPDSNTTNQELEATWQRISTLGTPTGTTITPAPQEKGDQAAASTVVGNITASEPTYAANTDIGHKGFSSLGGLDLTPIPEARGPYIQGSDTWGLRMISAPTSMDTQVTVVFREMG